MNKEIREEAIRVAYSVMVTKPKLRLERPISMAEVMPRTLHRKSAWQAAGGKHGTGWRDAEKPVLV